MNPNKVLWEKGDFTRIAQSMRTSGESLIDSLGNIRGLKILDLGCGDGTTALPEARHGADVLGVDIASNLVEAGNQRARAEGLTNCRFNVIERFSAAGVPKENISFGRETYTFDFRGTPSTLVEEFRKFYGPTINAFESAESIGKAGELQSELEDLFTRQNKSARKGTTSIPARYLRVHVALN